MSGPEDQGNYITCSEDRSWSVLGEDRSQTSHFPLRAQGDGWNDKHTMSSCVVLTVTLEVYKQELQFPFPK